MTWVQKNGTKGRAQPSDRPKWRRAGARACQRSQEAKEKIEDPSQDQPKWWRSGSVNLFGPYLYLYPCLYLEPPLRCRRFCMWLCFGVVWPQRDGRSCVLLDTATTDTLVLDQSFFRPLGMQHFYDSFTLESQICVRRDALVEWLTERCTFHADAKSSLAAQSKQHDRFVPCQQLGLCILRLHCLQFSIFFTMRRISCVWKPGRRQLDQLQIRFTYVSTEGPAHREHFGARERSYSHWLSLDLPAGW